MRPAMLSAVARAEIRSVRRLFRYWVFAVLSVVLTFVAYFYYAAIHGFASRFSATIGATGPRFIMSAIGLYVLALFVLGLVFLAFDIRARDERERMAEVLDSRPLTNAELLVGRSAGLVFMAWLPILFVSVLIQAFGFLANSLGWFLGDPVEPYSLLGFMFVDALSSFAIWCALLVLMSVLVRNRLIVAVAALVILGLNVWGLVRMPIYLMPALSVFSAIGTTASDLVPQLTTGPTLIQRGLLWVLSAGFLSLAVAFHPRPDGRDRDRSLIVGGVLVTLSFVGIGALALSLQGDIDRLAELRAVHEARAAEPRPDLESVTGTVRIEPGGDLGLDLELEVRAPEGESLSSLLFAFNPGLAVEEATVDGRPLEVRHESGLLELSLDRPLGSEIQRVSIVASGEPDTGFGYLDSSVDFLQRTTIDAQIALLGTETAIYSRRYVALMPGSHWLPRPGTDVPNGDPRTHPADRFRLDLEVEVPEGWELAGPGRREDAGGDEGFHRYRYRPGAPLPEVGLFAARLDRYTTEVEGVQVELLLSPKHDRNAALFAEAAEEIEAAIAEVFSEAEKLGLGYPYGALTVVESPALLRGYGGGWRLDTVQALPGVMLLRENGFPTSRFEIAFRNPERFEEREGGIARVKKEILETYFENDFSGGNPFLGASRNFFSFQTGAVGEGALALDFVCHELVNALLTGREGFFSGHIFDASMGLMIGETITEAISGNTDSIANALLTAATDRPSVWDRALGSSLAALDPHENPKQSLNVLALKGRAIARSIVDGLGREKTAALLATLLDRHRGGTFTAADLAAAAADVEVDLDGLLGNWLHESSLPGFVSSPVQVARLVDDADGNPRYQTTVHVRNDEPTPGLVRMRYLTGEGDEVADWHETEPLRVAALESLEYGLLSSSPPRELWLQPYLSLNRQDIQLQIPRVDQEEQSTEEAFLGARASGWAPERADEIVVDDLDDGFSVENAESENGVRLSGGFSSFFIGEVDTDQGLPEFNALGPPPREWSRREIASSYGRYRHTLALVSSGPGHRLAVFRADIPAAGRWRLDYHLPRLSRRQRSLQEPGVQINAQVGMAGTQGTYDISLTTGSDSRQLEFDGSAAEVGWNSLGEFDLEAGEASVSVSDETSGRLVLADAIRWRSLDQDR